MKDLLTNYIDSILAIIALIFSVVSFFLSHRVSKKANELSEQANKQSEINNALSEQANKITLALSSKEHEVAENLKYQVWQIITVLSSIEEKISYENEGAPLDIAKDIEVLLIMRNHPEYLVLQYLVSEEQRNDFKKNFYMLCFGYKQLQKQQIKSLIEDINAVVKGKEFTDHFKKVTKWKNDKLLNVINGEGLQEEKEFAIAYELRPRRKKDGQETIKPVMDKPQLSPEFEYKANTFLPFLDYLVLEKQIHDPAILMYIGVLKDKPEMVKQAANAGVDVNVTEDYIIDKYKEEYESYLRLHNKSLSKKRK